MEAFLSHIGINPVDVFAGFSGSLVAAALVSGPRPNLWQIISTILVGTLTASYLGPVAPTWIGMKPSAGGSFGVGQFPCRIPHQCFCKHGGATDGYVSWADQDTPGVRLHDPLCRD